MVPLSVLRDVNFVLFYSCLQYLIALAGDAVLPATHATAGLMFLRVQIVWLVVLYVVIFATGVACLLYTSPSPRDQRGSRMPSSA